MSNFTYARRACGVLASLCVTAFGGYGTAAAEAITVPTRVVSAVVDSDSVILSGNTHPLAKPNADRGRVDSSKRLERMMLVLQRSPKQDLDLAAFNERQHDQFSPDYHHWLSAHEFGSLYGPADADIAVVTQWLQSHGMQIYHVNEGKVSIEFSGTVAQVEKAFQVQMHRYVVDNVEHIANDRDPSIPRALAPVVNGVASLNDFRPTSLTVLGKYVRRDMKTGKVTPIEKVAAPSKSSARAFGINPNLGYEGNDGNEHEDVTPFDFATIYNSLPLWKESTPIIGTGVGVAIAAGSDISTSDVANFRKAFGLPAKSFTTIHNGTDPGKSGSNGDQTENTLDVEMVGAAAPGADIALVVSKGTSTSYGFELSMQYIVSNEIAPIMSASYGSCELSLGKSGNALFNGVEQQGATEGISIFISAGDQGSAGCDGHQSEPDQIGLQVNGMASTPYVTAVGGTDFTWSFIDKPVSTYWNSTTNSDGATAKGYLPEVPWNSTCVNPLLLNVFVNSDGSPEFANNEELCNAAEQDSYYQGLVAIGAGSGGVSDCTTPTGNTIASCQGGYAKPSWQTGSGVPSDGKRDLPDLSLYSSNWVAGGINGSAILFCDSTSSSNGCDYSDPDNIVFQEIGGTSAATPYMAGVMAMILQKTGAIQGLANPTFYQLAATESLSSCNSATVKNGNSCIFYDVTSGNIAQACVSGGPDCKTIESGDDIGILNNYSAAKGYDRATGLGSVNIANLVNAWSGSTPSPTVSVSPTSVTFPSTGVGSTSTAQTVSLKNTGKVAVSISKVALTGSQADDFVLTTKCGTSLAVGASCTSSVSFKPVSTGTKTASLSFSDNAGTQTVALSGSGTTASGSATVKLSVSSLAFGNQAPNTTSSAKTVTVTNSGTASVTFSSIQITGSQADDYALSKTCGTSLAKGASCTLSVTFTPVSTGTKTATLSIADNASGSPQSVALTGTGSTSSSAAAVKLSPTSLTFSTQKAGSTSAAKTVTVTNSGTATLTLSSIQLTGSQADDYVLSKTCASSLAAGKSCTLSVSFNPVSSGKKVASVSIADNASGSPQTVALTGTGD